jgi:hypothetical protein
MNTYIDGLKQMTRRTAILTTLGLATCCSFGESVRGQSKKPKGGTTVPVAPNKLSVGKTAPILAYVSAGTAYAVDFAAKVPGNVVRYPAVVIFVGKLTKAELSRFSKLLRSAAFTPGLTNFFVISLDEVKTPFIIISENRVGHPIKVVKGQTLNRPYDAITYKHDETTFVGPGYTLSTWGIKSSDKLVMFLIDGDGTIMLRHDGLDGLDSSAFQSVAKRTNKYRNGIPGELAICKQCNMRGVTRERCNSCNGLGKVRCVECSDGSYVNGNGRRLQCPFCEGTANVCCDRCGVRGLMPSGSGYTPVKCSMCDGYGSGWWPSNGGSKFVR